MRASRPLSPWTPIPRIVARTDPARSAQLRSIRPRRRAGSADGARRVRRLALVPFALLTLVACDSTRKLSPTGPSESGGVTVVSTTLEQLDDGGAYPLPFGCKIRGTLENDGTRNKGATVTFRALTGGGKLLGTAETSSILVPAGGRATYSAVFSVFDIRKCDSIDHVEIEKIDVQSA
jgi:hypothetical protein